MQRPGIEPEHPLWLSRKVNLWFRLKKFMQHNDLIYLFIFKHFFLIKCNLNWNWLQI